MYRMLFVLCYERHKHGYSVCTNGEGGRTVRNDEN